MWWRVLAVSVVLLAVGAVGGYAVSQASDDGPASLGRPAPVPADSPSVPTPPPVTVLPDPTDAPLGVDLPSQAVHLSTGKRGYKLSLAAPAGWVKSQPQGSQTQWYFAPQGAALNTYVLRVAIVAGNQQSVGVVEASRIDALRQTEKDGNIEDLSIQQSGDTFIATYVQRGYFRVSEERILDLGQSSAYVDLAVTGREVDRAGLMDLLARTSASMVAE